MVRHHDIGPGEVGAKPKGKTGWRCQYIQATIGQRRIERPVEGVYCFNNELRLHFVKGVEAVIIFIF